MRSFKRILKTVTVFVLIVALLSVFFIECYLRGENFHYQDAWEREAVSGKVTYLVCGASYTLFGIHPDVVDAKAGVNCYNLAGTLLTLRGRYVLLEQELARNPRVHTVVLEVSPDTLLRDRAQEGPKGDLPMLGRLDTAEARWRYFREAFTVDEWPEVYYDMVSKGMEAALRLVTGDYTTENQILSAGYYENDKPSKPIPTDYSRLYHIQSLPEEICPENVEWLEKIVALCRENNRSVYLVTTPQSQYYNCVNSNLDFFQDWFTEFAAAHELQYFNFNLFKGKLEQLPDESCFYDETHLNAQGGEIFTEMMVRVIRRFRHGKNVDKEFYRSYWELDHAEGG